MLSRSPQHSQSANIREAVPEDFFQMHSIRMSVKENTLPDSSLIKEADYTCFITVRGKGWIAERDGSAAGFAIIDCIEHNIWALFVHPDFEGLGIGKKLHHTMLDWYFHSHQMQLWLGTSPGTRAERFYRTAGWKEDGKHKTGEIRFTMSYDCWKNMNKR